MKSLLKVGAIFFITVVIILSVFLIKDSTLLFGDKYKNTSFELGVNLNENFGEINNKIVIDQYFLARHDNLSAVSLFFSTFNRENKGTTNVSIIDPKTNQILAENEISNERIADNKLKRIDFKPISDTKGNVYIIRISSKTVTEGQSITLWKDNKTVKNTMLMVNGKKNNGTIVSQLIYDNQFSLINAVKSVIFFFVINVFVWRFMLFLKKR